MKQDHSDWRLPGSCAFLSSIQTESQGCEWPEVLTQNVRPAQNLGTRHLGSDAVAVGEFQLLCVLW